MSLVRSRFPLNASHHLFRSCMVILRTDDLLFLSSCWCLLLVAELILDPLTRQASQRPAYSLRLESASCWSVCLADRLFTAREPPKEKRAALQAILPDSSLHSVPKWPLTCCVHSPSASHGRVIARRRCALVRTHLSRALIEGATGS